MVGRMCVFSLLLSQVLILQHHGSAHDTVAALNHTSRVPSSATQRESELREAALFTRQGEELCEAGRYLEAEQAMQRARLLRERWLDSDDLSVAEVLFWLAHIHYELDQLESAEPLLRRVLKVQEVAPAAKSADIVKTLNRLSTIYSQWGQHRLSLLYNDKALRLISEKNLENHFINATLLYNRAIFLRDDPDSGATYEELIKLNDRALEIARRTVGTNHRFIAGNYFNAGKIAHLYGRHQEALQKLHTALELWQHIPPHPRLILLTLHELATVLCDVGNFVEAERLFEQALSYEKILGPLHPKLHIVRMRLALMYLQLGRTQQARELLLDSLDLLERRTRSQGSVLSDNQFVRFAEQTQLLEEMLYSVLQSKVEDLEASELLMTHVLLRKGRPIDEAADVSRAINNEVGRTDFVRLTKLRDLRGQFAALALAGPGPGGDLEKYRRRLAELDEAAENIDSERARLSARLRAQRAIPRSREIIREVAHRLPADGALVEFVEFRGYRFDLAEKRQSHDSQYLLLVLRADGQIRARNLGSATQVDALIERLHMALSTPDSSAREYQAAGQLLFDRIFEPLTPFLANTRWLFISAEGAFHRIPLETLHDGQHFLTDRFQFVSLTSGRDLLAREMPQLMASSVEIFADPSYEAQPILIAQNTIRRGTSRGNRQLRPNSLVRLPGTRDEALSIKRLFPAAGLHLDQAASESALLGTYRPGILHIATHGLFADDQLASTIGGRTSQYEEDTLELSEHPLLRSALAMAGAAAQEGVQRSDDRPDGIVTALELSSMDLWGTQLVVLSACNSGRGIPRAGQGIYGLRRAVLIAGAETLVTSLWRVDDLVTKDLMIEYYTRLLHGADRAAALREAMHGIRRQFQHPYFWASFIIIGRSGPLQNLHGTP